MYKVALINMPFADLYMPSIALTQLRSVLARKQAEKIKTDIFYLNHDFVDLLGIDGYRKIANSIFSLNSGIGDWIFRSAAFPELPDNSEVYFRRYFPRKAEDSEHLKQLVAQVKKKLVYFIESLIDKYSLDQYDLVGLTSMFSQNLACFAMARSIKKRNQNLTVVMGGANCESPMGQELVKNVPAVDFVFSGPALKSFPAFVQYRIDGEYQKCHDIAGVFSKENTVMQGCRVIGEELNIDEILDLDYYAFIELIEKKYPGCDIPILLPFETSRGCWWGERAHCTFCGLNGMTMNYRAMRPDNALQLITSLFKYSSKVACLQSVDNIIPKNYLESVFPKLKTPKSMYIFYEVKADLSEQEIQILSDARVKVLQPGIESLATSTLKLMKKGTTSFNNITFLMNCLIHDVEPQWNLLVGFPGEGAEVYQGYLRDLPKLFHLPPPSGVYPIRFDRYSPYFKQAKEYGLNLRPLPFYELTYPFDQDSINNLAYYFTDLNYNADYFRTVIEYLPSLQQVVNAWKQKWDGISQPRLYLQSEDGKNIIYDSRTAEEKNYPISDSAEQILKGLARRKTLSELASGLDHIAEPESTSEIEILRKNGLIFEERGRYMSLVLPRKTQLCRLTAVKGG